MDKRKIKKVLFFTPPAVTFKDNLDINPLPPLGLAYLGSVLERAGIETKIVDCLVEGWENRAELGGNIMRVGLGFDTIEKLIRDFSPDIVGVNNLFTRQRENAHKIYAMAKKVSKDIIVVAGGAHPTVLPENVLSDENVDYVVLGEGETTFPDLIGFIEGRAGISSLDGVGLRAGGVVKIIPKKRFISDLDAIPFPARHLLNMEKYFGLEASHGARKCRKFSPIITSRGCPVGCTFCSAHCVWGRPFRKRSPMNIIKEMEEMKDRYGIEELMFEDDNVTLDVKRAEEIFDLMIERKLGFKWDTPNGTSAFALSERLIDKMKEAGCYRLNIAVESGNKEVLKNIIKKPVDLDKVARLVQHAKKIGLETNIFLIIGLPGETLNQMWDSYKFAKRLGLYNPFVSVATPYPGSELYEQCIEKGYIEERSVLDKLYITSFSISTEDWSGDDVRKTFRAGYDYLRAQYYRSHPLSFLSIGIKKLFTNPKEFLERVKSLLRNIFR